MSSHRRRIKHFSRKSGPRKALIRGLVVALVEHGRIKTTVDRAKEVRRHVEKAITLGKDADLAARRLLLSRFPNESAVRTIVDDLSSRFKSRPGGYTRVIKIGRRPGDAAEMAFIEFVDYDFEKATSNEPKKTVKKSKKAGTVATKAVAEKKASKKSSKTASATA